MKTQVRDEDSDMRDEDPGARDEDPAARPVRLRRVVGQLQQLRLLIADARRTLEEREVVETPGD